MVRVLFVCLGNICRSPMAEAVFAHKVRLAGLEEKIHADSAGTGHWHVGQPSHSGTRGVLKQKGIDYFHRARVIAPSDLHTFDTILTMDNANLADVQGMPGAGTNIHPFLEYAPDTGVSEVPDPYYDGRFEDVYALVDKAAAGLLAAIRREHGF